MAYSLVTHTVKQTADTNSVTSNAIDTTGCTLLLIAVADYAVNTKTAITDSKGNSWTELTIWAGSVSRIRILYSVPTSVGSGHTFTATGTTTFVSIAVQAWSGAATVPFDQQNGNQNPISPFNSIQVGSVTPSENNEIVVAALISSTIGSTYTIDSGMTISDQAPNVSSTAFGIGFAYIIQTTAGAINPTWSFSASDSNASSIDATFKAAAGVTSTLAGASIKQIGSNAIRIVGGRN